MRLIDADNMKKISEIQMGNFNSIESIRKWIDRQPTIEAAPVVHGFNDNRNYHEAYEFICSVCRIHLEDWVRHIYEEETDDEDFQEYIFKYCPNCGAKMGGVK